MDAVHHTQSGGTAKRVRSNTKRARHHEEDDVSIVEHEPLIMGQLRGGAGSYTAGRRYFNIQYEDKEEAKADGALWDKDAKEWYAADNKVAKKLKRTWGELGIIPKKMFYVPLSETEEAKRCGARFCWQHKLWYAADQVTLQSMEEKWDSAEHQPQARKPEGPPAPPTPEKAPPTPVRKQRTPSQTQARRADSDRDGEDCEDGNSQCVVCWGAARSVGFLHEGEVHVCACKECGDRWFKKKGTCPMCRRPAESTVIVFR